MSERTPMIDLVMGQNNLMIESYQAELNYWCSVTKLESLTDLEFRRIKMLRENIEMHMHFKREFSKGSEEENIIRMTNSLCAQLLDYELGILLEERNELQYISDKVNNNHDCETDPGIIHETTI